MSKQWRAVEMPEEKLQQDYVRRRVGSQIDSHTPLLDQPALQSKLMNLIPPIAVRFADSPEA